MNCLRISLTALIVAAAAASPAGAEVSERVTVKETRVIKRVIVKRVVTRRVVTKAVSVSSRERDGAIQYSRKVLSREYAYPRLSPGLLPTSVAVAYDYYYVPDYGFAYRLAPPVPPGAACLAAPQLMYNSRGEFAGYGEGLRCY
jgi:hypothetical protein